MEQQFIITIPGQEVEVPDINGISANAALAVERALAELLRMGKLSRGIIPWGTDASDIGNRGAPAAPAGVIRPSGSSDASVQIYNFRAVLAASAIPNIDIERWQGNRSAIFDGRLVTVVGPPGVFLQFAEATNNRYDLVYAKLDINVPDAPEIRYVKDASEAITAVSVSKTISTNITVGIVLGVEGATPAAPALPVDSGSSYYLLIGYVFLPAGHTLMTAIPPGNITEAFVALPIAPSAGVANIRPATLNLTASDSPAVGLRARGYISPSVVGGETRILALAHDDGPRNLSAGANIVDDSIDWRNRLFKVSVSVSSSVHTDGSGLPWLTGNSNWVADGYVPIPYQTMGQSFHANPAVSGHAGAANMAVICQLDNVSFPGHAFGVQSILICVSMLDGKLYAIDSTTGFSGNFILWIEATGYYPNAF